MVEILPDVFWHTEIEAFDTLAPAWRHWSLSERDPYLDPVWYRTWWQAFGQRGAELMLIEIRQPVPAILPLMLRDGVISFLGNIYSHRQGIIAAGSTIRVWEKILPWLESLRDWRVVNLRQLPEYRPEVDGFRSLVGNSASWYHLRDEIEQWAIPLSSWDEHWQQQGRNSRKKRKRVQQQVVSGQTMRIIQYRTYDEAILFSQVYFQVMVQSWKLPDQSRDFFRNLCRRFAALGWFNSFALFLGDVPIAFQFGFLVDSVYYCYKTAYDTRYAALSPGITVIEYAISTLTQQGAQKVDLLTGNDIYKKVWCNQIFKQVGFFYPMSLKHLVDGRKTQS